MLEQINSVFYLRIILTRALSEELCSMKLLEAQVATYELEYGLVKVSANSMHVFFNADAIVDLENRIPIDWNFRNSLQKPIFRCFTGLPTAVHY